MFQPMIKYPSHKMKFGEHAGKELKDVPPRYLLYIFDNKYKMEEVVRKFVIFNYEELKKLV